VTRRVPKDEYRTGQKIPESGIYRVTHDEHRLPHEVTLLKGAQFPRCSKCRNAVRFAAVSLAPRLDSLRERVTIYELPAISEDAA
jgi:hypothetical protein